MRRQSEEADRRESVMKTLRSEHEGMRGLVGGLEERVRQVTADNQMYLQKIIEMKDEQAEAFN